MTRNPLSEAAVVYATFGWSVLPLVPNAKNPLTKNGLLDATTEPSQVVEWWRRWPNANVGLRTGSAFDVLDIDGDVGRASLEAIAGSEERHSGPVTRTGRGEHWLYESGGYANRANMMPKLDWRGVNGYIVAPPSIHPDGHKYTWAQHPFTFTIPPIPDWLTPILTKYTPSQAPKYVITPHEYDPLNVESILTAAHIIGLEYKKRGRVYEAHCIFHEGDNEASLKLYTDDNHFYCFGCNAWGDSRDLLARRPGGHK